MQEIAKEIGASEEETLEAIELGNAYDTVSLDSKLPHEGESAPLTLAEFVGDLDASLQSIETYGDLKQAVDCLEPREKAIIYYRFFKDMSQTEVAKRLNISQMHVSRLQQKALKRLERTLERLALSAGLFIRYLSVTWKINQGGGFINVTAIMVIVAGAVYCMNLIYDPVISPVLNVITSFCHRIYHRFSAGPCGRTGCSIAGFRARWALPWLGWHFWLSLCCCGLLVLPKMVDQATGLAQNFGHYLEVAQKHIDGFLAASKPMLTRLHLPTTTASWTASIPGRSGRSVGRSVDAFVGACRDRVQGALADHHSRWPRLFCSRIWIISRRRSST